MALASLNFESQYLHCKTDVRIILPNKSRKQDAKDFYVKGRKYPVLWLLHGGMGDCTDWVRYTNIELYACEHDLAVIMPSAYNSIYSNWPQYGQGLNVYDFFFEELMPLIYAWFPISDQREDNFVAGLSMGGKGTLKFALLHPEKFAAAAVLSSSPMLVEERLKTEAENHKYNWTNMVEHLGGLDGYYQSDDNLYGVINKRMADGSICGLPRIYLTIGGNDKGLYNYHVFKEFCQKNRLPFSFHVEEGYEHEWRFWDKAIQNALEFFGFVQGDIQHRKGNIF